MLAWCYVLIIYGPMLILITMGHKAYLLYAFWNLLMNMEEDSIQNLVLCCFWSLVPMFVVIGTVLAGTCAVGCGRRSLAEYTVLGLIINSIISAVFYAFQVVAYIVAAAVFTIKQLPTDAICRCVTATDQTYDCWCEVPGHDQFVYVPTKDMHSLVDESVSYYGHLNYTGYVNVTLDERIIADKEVGNEVTSQIMLLVQAVQLSLLVVVLRLPVWISIHLLWRDTSARSRQTLAHRLGLNDVTVHFVLTLSRQRSQDSVLRRRSGLYRLSQVNVHYAMELCIFGFIEGVDAFSLLDNFFEHGEFFRTNSVITKLLLAAICLNVVIVSFTNLVACLPRRTAFLAQYAKLVVVLMSNLPLCAVRAYIYYSLHMELGSIFVLFLVKEVAVILLAGFQGIFELCSAEKPANHIPTDVEGGSRAGTDVS